NKDCCLSGPKEMGRWPTFTVIDPKTVTGATVRTMGCSFDSFDSREGRSLPAVHLKNSAAHCPTASAQRPIVAPSLGQKDDVRSLRRTSARRLRSAGSVRAQLGKSPGGDAAPAPTASAARLNPGPRRRSPHIGVAFDLLEHGWRALAPRFVY